MIAPHADECAYTMCRRFDGSVPNSLHRCRMRCPLWFDYMWFSGTINGVVRAITYEATNPDPPGWEPGAFPRDQRLGLAYAVDDFFVHFYGQGADLWVVSSGLTFTEPAAGPLEDWVTKVFGANDIQHLDVDAGHVVDGVWRPGLFWVDQIWQALGTDQREQRAAEQSLHLLVSALNDLSLYIEPEGAGLNAYGPKTRELLILACTEVADGWSRYLRRAGRPASPRGYTTNDYVALLEPLHLAEYQLSLVPFARAPKLRPFAGWRASAPTQSLTWYDAYNKTKHDRSGHLSSATLERCVEAVAANVVLYCVRFSPYQLFTESTPLASVATHLFSMELVGVDTSSFYVPMIDPTKRARKLVCRESRNDTAPWRVVALPV
jgi:hypothetical protein